MPRVMVAWSEVTDILRGLTPFDIAGQMHVDAEELAVAISHLCGARLTRPDALGHMDAVEVAHAASAGTLPPAPPVAPPADDEAERARLAALPPGDCWVCKHGRHDGGECPDCGCREYLDSVVRDPGTARLLSGATGPGGPIESVDVLGNIEFVPEPGRRMSDRFVDG